MRTRLLFPCLILLSLLTSVGAAQSPKTILKNAAKALGGEKALKSVKSWKRSGLITRLKDDTEGEYRAQGASPNRYHAVYDLNGFETEAGANGRSGWVRDSREGLRTLTGDASRDFEAEVEYRNQRWLDYRKQKAAVIGAGRTQIEGKLVNIVDFVDAQGVRIKLFFDAGTSLLVREEIPAGGTVNSYDYSDYRLVGRIREPFGIKAQIDGEAYQIKLDQVVHNVSIPDESFDFPRISGEPLPDISKLLQELQANEDRVEEILENYSFKQKSIKRELGKDGILRETESETYLLTFYKGNRISRLIEKNGRPLLQEDQEKEDREVQGRVREIEKKIAKEEQKAVEESRSGPPDENSRRISIAEVLRASSLVNPRRERLKGREVIVFDFEPNPGFNFDKAKSFLKFFGKTGGVIWIDEKDKQVARIEAELFDSYKIGGGLLAKLRKGASFTLEQERVNDEIWLPSAADINLSVRVLLVKGITVNQVIRSYDYNKFNTEVRDSKVGDVQKP